MPYKDPAKKQQWEREHRSERQHAFIEAVNWTNREVKTLSRLGCHHTRAEWGEIRRALLKSRLSGVTLADLRQDTPTRVGLYD